MRYIVDPKKAMMRWAQHKLRTDAPTIVGPTSTMLLKAEARAISALMNCKSPAQTKQIMVAAYRRAGLLVHSHLKMKPHLQPYINR